jgi:hypothetical protein
MTTSYSASGIKPKRTRRTNEELAELDQRMIEFIQEYKPVSVRQVFYHLAAIRMIPKDQNQYDSIQKRLSNMRKDKIIPYEWISDGTRWMRKPDTFNSVRASLEYAIRTYRRAIWTDQRIHLEFWLEKEALAGTINDILDEWDIPFYVSRGFSSHSYLYKAAQYLMSTQKEAHIYVMTDCDQKGLAIKDCIRNAFAEHCADHPYDIYVHRLALTPDQVMGWGLQSRDAKPGKGVLPGNQDADLDAIPPTQFRWLVEDAIASHVDQDRYQRLLKEEELERETLTQFMSAWDQQDDQDQHVH